MTAYRTNEISRLSDLSFKQLDYWDRAGIFQPSVMAANGSGTQRLYSDADLRALRIMRGIGFNRSRSQVGALTLRRIAWLSRALAAHPPGTMAVMVNGSSFVVEDDAQVLAAIRASGGAPVRVFTVPEDGE